MSGGRNGWFSGALFCGILSGLTWFAPFSDQVHSRKGRAVAAAFDTVVQPVIDAAGKFPIVAVFAVAALFMLWRGLGLGLPGLSGARPNLSRFRRERPEGEAGEAGEPTVPHQRRRDLSRLALTDEGAHPPLLHSQADDAFTSREPDHAEQEADETAPAPLEEEVHPPLLSPLGEQANIEVLAARHALDDTLTKNAMLESYRSLMGPDAELSDALYERAVSLVREQRRRSTPHGQRIDPVAIVRKPREKSRDWTRDRSWLGGLPRLGEAEWPRGKDGKPLPFVAQIDLAEVAAVHPDTPLPADGSLAFFIGSGAVIHVPPGSDETADLPDDLPPAFGEGGHPLPERHSRVTHRIYPFWPVEPIRLRLPDGLPGMPGPDDDDDAIGEIRDAQVAALHAIVPPRQSFASAGETMPGGDKLWWHGADYVLRQLEEAYDFVDRAVALREKWIADAQGYQARLAAETPPDTAKIADSKRGEERNREAIPAIRQQGEGLREFVEHFEGFVAGKQPWDEMSGEEIAILEDVLAEARAQFPELCRSHVPRSTRDVRAICIRRMITGDASAVAALPDDLLDWLNSRNRLAAENQHQMFGVGGCQQHALYDHLCDHLLLQLGPDEMAELDFPDMGIWQFWISPEDLDARLWDKATLTFECG